jgi:hypothetical protein
MNERRIPTPPRIRPVVTQEEVQELRDDIESLHARLAVNEIALESLATSHSQLLEALFDYDEAERHEDVELEDDPDPDEDDIQTNGHEILSPSERPEAGQLVGHPEGRPPSEADEENLTFEQLAERANEAGVEDYE